MQKIILLLIISCCFLSACEKYYSPRTKIQVSLETFTKPGTSIRALTVLNDSTMMYAGSQGDITSTSDLGKTWSTQQIKTDSITPHFRAISSTNKAFYALNVGNPALLYQLKGNQFKIVYKEEHPNVFYNSMAFLDDLNGIAMGDPIDNCLSIIITRDGGNSWGKMDCSFLPKLEPGEAAFAASNTNISIVGEHAWIVTGGTVARIYHTSDKGLTWEVLNSPIIHGQPTTGIYTSAFYNEKQGIIMGGDYTHKNKIMDSKALTTDGGKTWEIIQQEQPSYISCVQYIPDTHGMELLATSTEGIYHSNDKGSTWEKISSTGFYSLRMIDKNTAWLAGNEKVALLKIL